VPAPSNEERRRDRFVRSCRRLGWQAWVLHGSAYTGRGRPDTIVCAEGRFVAVEWKTEKGVISAAQHARLNAVTRAGGIAFVATDVDTAITTIKERIT
jgi:hypothetical protein